MEIILTPKPPRKLVAVLGIAAMGLWMKKGDGTVFIDQDRTVFDHPNMTLEDALNETDERTGIYEGDELVFKF